MNCLPYLGRTPTFFVKDWGGDTIYIKKDNLENAHNRQDQFIDRYYELKHLGHKKALQMACREFDFSDRWGDILLKRQNPLYANKIDKNQLAFEW